LYSLTDNYAVSSKISNQARFGINSIEATSTPQEPFTAAQLGITSPFASLYPGAPTIQVAGADASFLLWLVTAWRSAIQGLSAGTLRRRERCFPLRLKPCPCGHASILEC